MDDLTHLLEVNAAVVKLAEENLSLRYRVFVLQEVLVELVRELQERAPSRALQLSSRVRAWCSEMMDERQAAVEADGQKAMLQVLNAVLAAAKQPPVPDGDDV